MNNKHGISLDHIHGIDAAASAAAANYFKDYVEYVDGYGYLRTHNATRIDSGPSTTLDNNWFYVEGTVVISGILTINQNVNIILTDGSALIVGTDAGGADAGVKVTAGNNLTIHGQSGGTGVLSATANGFSMSGIGGGGNVTINGGIVSAVGGVCGAGIGDIGTRTTINGGRITATGVGGGAAIGGGCYRYGGTIVINGGNISTIVVDPGTISAGGVRIGAAGIGGGGDRGWSGYITINGGTIRATGGQNGAGVGGGSEGGVHSITINGGTVNATAGGSGGGGAGVGGGSDGDGGTITINGGTVNATGGVYGAGVGCGNRSNGGTVFIKGGVISARSTAYGAGIGCGAYGEDCSVSVSINGGNITAYAPVGAGIGGGGYTYNNSCSISINGGIVFANSSNGAGVGGGLFQEGGSISINGGRITASSNSGGAGVGGGTGGSGGTISINGGIISATGSGGAGIGGGVPTFDNVGTVISFGNGGMVTITGGSIYAVSGTGENIGRGFLGVTSGTLMNANNETVYLNTITVGVQAVGNTSVTDASIDGVDSYGVKDVATTSEGRLYLYLPASSGAQKVALTVNDEIYCEMYTRLTVHGNVQVLKNVIELFESAVYTGAQANIASIEDAVAKVEDIVGALLEEWSISDVSTTVLPGQFTAATAGTSGNADGTDGSFKFVVLVDNNKTTAQTTAWKMLTITATAFSAAGPSTEAKDGVSALTIVLIVLVALSITLNIIVVGVLLWTKFKTGGEKKDHLMEDDSIRRGTTTGESTSRAADTGSSANTETDTE